MESPRSHKRLSSYGNYCAALEGALCPERLAIKLSYFAVLHWNTMLIKHSKRPSDASQFSGRINIHLPRHMSCKSCFKSQRSLGQTRHLSTAAFGDNITCHGLKISLYVEEVHRKRPRTCRVHKAECKHFWLVGVINLQDLTLAALPGYWADGLQPRVLSLDLWLCQF